MRLIKIAEVMYKTSMAHSTIYKYIALDLFPRPVKIGNRSVAWLEEDITNWIQSKVNESTRV